MSLLFWLDIAAYGVSMIIALSLAFVVLGSGPGRALNRLFGLFTLSESLWAATAILSRMSLGFQAGNPVLWLELSAISFFLMGPFFLMFAVRYTDRRSIWADLLALVSISIVTIIALSPSIKSQLVFNPRLSLRDVFTYDISTAGVILAALLPVSLFTWSLVLFWRERYKTGESYLAWSASILIGGFITGGLWRLDLPIMSITTTLSVSILGYGIVRQQILNPLRELGRELGRQVRKQTMAEREQRLLAETLADVTLALTAQTSHKAVLDEILRQAQRIVPYSTANIALLEGDTLRTAHWRGYKAFGNEEFISKLVQPLADFSLDAEVIRSRKPQFIANTHHDPRWVILDETEWIRSTISVPICHQDRVLGLLRLDSNTPGEFSAQDARRLQPLADAAAIALENARLFTATRRQAKELETLHQMTQDLAALRDPDTLLQQIVEQAVKLLGGDAGSILLYRPEKEALEQVVTSATAKGNLVAIIKSGEGLSGKVWAANKPMIVDDYKSWPGRLHQFPIELGAMVAVPIRRGDEFLGVLNVGIDSDSTSHHFEPQDAVLLSQFAAQAAIAIHNARLYRDERASRQRAEALRQASQAMGSSLELDEILRLILEQLGQVITYNTASLLIFRGDSPDLVVGIGYDDEAMVASESSTLLQNSPILSKIVQSRQPVVYGDVRQVEDWVLVPGAEHVRSWLGVPLVIRYRVIGVLMADSIHPDFFKPDQVRITQALAQHAAQAIENSRLFQGLQNHTKELETRVAERTHELAEANKQLQILDRLKSKFVSDVSHELRTPVANIKLYLHLLKRGDLAKQEKYIAILQEQTDRLANLIQDILDLSRLDLGGDKIEFAAIDLNALVAQVITAHQPRAEAEDLAITFEPDKTLPRVWAEQNQLAQVITNLVVNALNYTLAGQVRVSTHHDAENKQACLEIQDTGMGIDPEDMPHLFERFYRGRHVGSSNIPGTGLGLAIVKEIVDLHGGKIKVESPVDWSQREQPAQGSSFKVWLPLEEKN